MFSGILLSTLAGVLLGVTYVPMRYMKAFAWENTWFIWALFLCVVFPPLIAWATIPELGQVFHEVGPRPILIVLAVGTVAGTSGVLFGRGLALVGMTMANSLSNGVALVVGSFIPLVMQHREAMQGKFGLVVMGGLLLSVAGITVCAVASTQQNQESAYVTINPGKRSKTFLALLGVTLCILSGLFTPLQNLGIAFGDTFMVAARNHGASPVFETFAFYVPYLGTSFVANLVYCGYLWKKNGTVKQFREPGGLRFTSMAVAMGAVSVLGMLFYGAAMPPMKSYGPVIGWPVQMVTTSLASAAVECWYGDWKGRALRTLLWGLGVQAASLALFAWANLLIQA